VASQQEPGHQQRQALSVPNAELWGARSQLLAQALVQYAWGHWSAPTGEIALPIVLTLPPPRSHQIRQTCPDMRRVPPALRAPRTATLAIQ
jgi:hypothetical protein